MSSTRRVGSSFLASSHICWTHCWELSGLDEGLVSMEAALNLRGLLSPALSSRGGEGEDWAPGGIFVRWGGACNLSTKLVCPPKPQVSLNRHQAKIEG